MKFKFATMDADNPNVYQEFSNMQLKITILFQDLMKERNNYKQNYENLNIDLSRLCMETDNIKKENEKLRQFNDEIKSIICKSVRVFSSIDFSCINIKKEHKIELENFASHSNGIKLLYEGGFAKSVVNTGNKLFSENLKKNFLDAERMLESIYSKRMNVKPEVELTGKSTVMSTERNKMSEEEIQNEFESIKNLKFSTQFFCEDEIDDSTCTNLFKRKPEEANKLKKVKEALTICETESSDLKHINANSCESEKMSSKKSVLPKSPVFKDFGLHKQDNVLSEESDSTYTSSPLKSVNEKFGVKPENFVIGSWKRSNSSTRCSPRKEPATPKRVRKKLKINSPNRSPKMQLKKSNSREAEISVSGIRKLTQTLLNVECYKKKNKEDWKNCENRENGNFISVNDVLKSEAKNPIDAEEDDFIIESPTKTDQLSEDIKSKNRAGNVLNNVDLITPPNTSDADLDETYISASIVRKSKLTKKRSLEKVIEDLTPLKRPAREKSPDYSSVPFVYKRDPIKKKSERMKLPGHACLECNKYYENALGDIDAQNLKIILNKCSRHRDKNSPTQETPPGFWKPYLTCSIKVSPKKNDVR